MVIDRNGGPDVFEPRDLPVPTPGPRDLLVRVCATSVNPIDAKLRAGVARVGLSLPAVLGYDVSGVAEAVGPEVTRFAVGDEVFYSPPVSPHGSYCQYHVADEGIVERKPTGLSHEEAAALPLAGCTAWGALFVRGELRIGQTALIHAGAGGVGSLAVQLAFAAGARVLATCSAGSADLVRGLGAERTIDYRNEDFVQATLEATKGRGVDLVLDTVGGETLARSLGAVRPFGRLVSITNTNGDLAPAYLNNAAVFFMFMQRSRVKMQALRRLVEAGRVQPVVEAVLPLEQVAEAHRRLEAGGRRGKLVLRVQ